jgi:ureidoacrylate peracid hydrolase
MGRFGGGAVDLAEKVRPAHTALLVVDVQKDYFGVGGIIDLMGDDPRGLEALLPPLDRFLDVARRVLPVVIFTQQSFYPFLRSAAVVEHFERAGMSRPFDPDREAFYHVSPRLPPEGRDIVLKKHKYSAFIGTALDGILRSNGIGTIIVTGIATNVCVESTVRDGFMMDYHVVVPSDLVAGVNEEYKAWSLRNIGRYFGHVLESADILAAWADPAAGSAGPR